MGLKHIARAEVLCHCPLIILFKRMSHNCRLVITLFPSIWFLYALRPWGHPTLRSGEFVYGGCPFIPPSMCQQSELPDMAAYASQEHLLTGAQPKQPKSWS